MIEPEASEKVEGKQAKPKKISVISAEDVPDSEKIIRYSKFKLAKKLLIDTKVSDVELVGIILGIRFEEEDRGSTDGRNYTGALSSLLISNNDRIIDKEEARIEIEQAAVSTGVYDYIFPKVRKEHLKAILHDSSSINNDLERKSMQKQMLGVLVRY
jgi:hypothetical protein